MATDLNTSWLESFPFNENFEQCYDNQQHSDLYIFLPPTLPVSQSSKSLSSWTFDPKLTATVEVENRILVYHFPSARMDSEGVNPEAPISNDEQLGNMLALPYASVSEELEYREVIGGPRFSSCHSQPQVYYGPITIRNYLAGYVMQSIRKSALKTTPCYQSVFMNLPTEIQLMVLEHLHPLDLYHFSKTSKYFRKLVMTPRAIGVWRMALQRHPELPKCPPTVRESQWTFMLFGPGICVRCGKYGALTDFAFLKQYCEVCMKAEYAYRSALRDSKNNIVRPDHIVFSLLPRSYRYNGLRYTISYNNVANGRYIRKDFDAMMKKVTLVQLLIDNGVPRLAELFDEYTTALASHWQAMEKACDEANTWANEIFRHFSKQYETALQKVTDICKKKLANRGHENTDISFVQWSLSHILRSQRMFRFTTKAYRLVLPNLDTYVTNQKVTRLKRERRQLLEGIYKNYEKTLSPDTWEFQPPLHLVKDMEEFSEFLNAPFIKRGDVEIGYAISLFPRFAEDWTKKHQLEIIRLLRPPGETKQDPDIDLKIFELATSVITCLDCRLSNQGGRVLLGWKNICHHKRSTLLRHYHPCSKFEVNPVATAAAASVISCAGLNTQTATIHDMNDRNYRFMCGNCLPETFRGINGMKVYTWNECITHSMDVAISGQLPGHDPPLWFLLTPEAEKFVKEHEHAHPLPSHRIWHCNHCAEHYDDRAIQKDAIRHVEQVHLIRNPVIGHDVNYSSKYAIKRRRHFRLGTEPAHEFKCQRCVSLPITQLWEMQNLLVHLRVKHRIPDPLEGEDWTRVQIIAIPQSTDTS